MLKNSWISFIILMALGLLSCSKSPSNTGPLPTPPKTGDLVIEVFGLTTGLKGDIDVIGPDNYSSHVTSTDTLRGLNVGAYSILASAIVDSLGDTIAVNPDSQQVTILVNKAVKAQVFYQAVALGSLGITASGLPPGEKYDIVITSQDDPSFVRQIKQSIQLDSLKPGPYRIVANEIVIKGKTYKPNMLDQIVNIVGGVFSKLSIIYQPKYGSLSVLIIGLPSGNDADVEISGPGNMYKNIFQSDLLDSLEVGDYTIMAYEVTLKDGSPYKATPDSQVVTVRGDEVTSANIDYRPKFGVLILDIIGLPEGTDPDVIVDGPSLSGGIAYFESQYIDSLEGGDYSIIAKSVTASDGTKYVPDLDSQVVAVVGGDTSFATVEYKENVGALSVLIIGLPSNTSADVNVTGVVNNFNETLEQTALIDTLKPGSYTITAQDVTASDGTAYAPDPDSQLVIVTVGDTVESIIDYKPKHGVLSVSITGLPIGIDGDVYVKGPTFPELNVIESIWIDSLEPGDFSIIGLEVTASDGTVYKPDIDSQVVAVVAGDTSSAIVVYKEKYGKLKVDVTGLPSGVFGNITIRSEDQLQLWNIESSEVIDSMPAGKYTVLAYEVTDLSGDTLTPEPDSIDVNVAGGDTAKVSIEYIGYTFKVFSDPDYPRQSIRYRDYCDHHQEVSEFLSDTVSGHSWGHMYNECTILNNDITETGSSKLYEVNSTYCSGSISEEITVDKNLGKVTIVKVIEASAMITNCDTVGASTMRINSETESSGSPLIVEIGNRFKDTIIVHVSGFGEGTINYTVPVVEPYYSGCRSSFGFLYSNCSSPYYYDTNYIDQLYAGAVINYVDQTITNNTNMQDSVILATTDSLISLSFFRHATGIARSYYIAGQANASSSFILTTEVTIWVERRRVDRGE